MRKNFSDRVERARVVRTITSTCGDDFGEFLLRTNEGVSLHVIASPGLVELPWDHVSVTVYRGQRCPTWDEMCWVKSLFFDEEETVIEFHPPKSKYVNFHPYCLHLWRPIFVELPLPPLIML